MATPTTPSGMSVYSTPKTGTWKHPRIDEIIARRNKSTFNSNSAQKLIATLITLTLTFVVPSIIVAPVVDRLGLSALLYRTYATYALVSFRCLLLISAVITLLPLVRLPDKIEDIPMTPTQRALLGLEPSSTPITDPSRIHTPPRYTPQSSTPGSGAATRGSNSPLSLGGFDSGRRSMSGSREGSPFSPSHNASPLLQKAIGSTTRRYSFGSNGGSPLRLGSPINPGSLFGASTGLDSSLFRDSSSGPGTPTPVMRGGGEGKGPSVGLNSKWLYERQGRSFGRSSFGGSGGLFS